jgi:hypothetical protein
MKRIRKLRKYLRDIFPRYLITNNDPPSGSTIIEQELIRTFPRVFPNEQVAWFYCEHLHEK